LFDFRDKVYRCTAQDEVPDSAASLETLKKDMVNNAAMIRVNLRNQRAQRIMLQLCWVIVCTVLRQNDEAGCFEKIFMMNDD
jgi:hypothetical protein